MIPLLAPLPEIVLRIRNAVSAAIGAMLRVVRIAWVLVISVAVLISLDVVPVLFGLPLCAIALCTWPLVALFRLLVVLLLVKALAEARMRLRLRSLPAGTADTGRTPRTVAVVAVAVVAAVDAVVVAGAGAAPSSAPAASLALPVWSCQSVSAGAFAGPWRGTST
jgi:hypothetical protein